jgi:hypothetical protein
VTIPKEKVRKEEFIVTVRDANHHTYTATTNDQATITDVKRWYGGVVDHPPARFVFHCDNVHLAVEDATLREYNINDGDVLDVVFVKKIRRS